MTCVLRAVPWCVAPCFVLAGCFWGEWGEGDWEPWWCSAEPAAADTLFGAPERSGDGRVSVREDGVVVVPGSAAMNVWLPIDAATAVPAATVEVWFERFGTGERLVAANSELPLAVGANRVRLTTGPVAAELRSQTRLGYRLTIDGEGEGEGDPISGYISLAETLQGFRVHTDVPATLVAGTGAPVRIVGTLGGNQVARFAAEVALTVGATTIDVGVDASELGVATATLQIPADLVGEGAVTIAATPTAGEPFTSTVPVTVVKGGALLLSTDKPRYQPGQTMHLRLMALHRPAMTPLGDEEVLVEIADGKGLKVFKETLTTNPFGIAHTTFKLADEVNTGAYQLTATLGDEVAAEQVIVERYALPKFTVSVAPDQRYVLAGQPLTGAVDVRYTFGEPVPRALVAIDLAYGDDTLIATLAGSTDEAGRYRFSLDVPTLAATDAVALRVEVTDLAGQTSAHEMALATADQGIGLWLVPAHDRVAGEPWSLYLVARDPAGRPVQAAGYAVFGADTLPVATNAVGIATITVPAGAAASVLSVSVESANLLRGAAEFAVGARDFPSGLALRTEHPRYAAGQTANLTVAGPPEVDEILVEVLQGGVVLHADTVALDAAGAATLPLPIAAALDGVVVIEAFGITGGGEPLRGRTAMYVLSERKLRIGTALDQQVYRPGETARLELQVSDRHGAGVPAALGLVVVDEAVYALQTLNPTTYRQFFAGESLPADVARVMDSEQAETLLEGDTLAPEQALAARAVLAAAAHQRSSPQAFVDQLVEQERYHATFVVNAALVAVAERLRYASGCQGAGWNQVAAEATKLAAAAADPWGRAYTVEVLPQGGTAAVTLRSAGPDERPSTGDDIAAETTINQ